MQHIDHVTRNTISSLIESASHPCISLYCPMEIKGKDTEQNSIRYKNLINQTEKQLKALGFRDTEIQPLLESARALIPETPYWQHQNQGLAVFMAPNVFETYRLPIKFQEHLTVSPRFHIMPVLPFVSKSEETFYILALDLQKMALYRATPFELEDISPENMPINIEELLQYEEPERQLQYHTGTGEGKGKRPAMFHGHGTGGDDVGRKDEILRFFQSVNRELREVLADKSQPLLLAGQEYLVGLYRQANSYNHLADTAVTKDPETFRNDDLHQHAILQMQDYLNQTKQHAIERFPAEKKTSKDLAEILHATTRNQVEILFVAEGAEKWGEFDANADEIVYHEAREPEDVNLYDVAAEKSFLHKAQVFVLPKDDMPTDTSIAAIFRFVTER